MYNVEEKKEVSGASINGRLNGDIDDNESESDHRIYCAFEDMKNKILKTSVQLLGSQID